MSLIHNPNGASASATVREKPDKPGDTDPTETIVQIGPRDQDSGTAGTLSVHLKSVAAEDLLCAGAINTGGRLKIPGRYYTVDKTDTIYIHDKIYTTYTILYNLITPVPRPCAPGGLSESIDIVGQPQISDDGYGASLL